jgi:hypothetical protein
VPALFHRHQIEHRPLVPLVRYQLLLAQHRPALHVIVHHDQHSLAGAVGWLPCDEWPYIGGRGLAGRPATLTRCEPCTPHLRMITAHPRISSTRSTHA